MSSLELDRIVGAILRTEANAKGSTVKEVMRDCLRQQLLPGDSEAKDIAGSLFLSEEPFSRCVSKLSLLLLNNVGMQKEMQRVTNFAALARLISNNSAPQDVQIDAESHDGELLIERLAIFNSRISFYAEYEIAAREILDNAENDATYYRDTVDVLLKQAEKGSFNTARLMALLRQDVETFSVIPETYYLIASVADIVEWRVSDRTRHEFLIILKNI